MRSAADIKKILIDTAYPYMEAEGEIAKRFFAVNGGHDSPCGTIAFFWIAHLLGGLPSGQEHIHQVAFTVLSLVGLLDNALIEPRMKFGDG